MSRKIKRLEERKRSPIKLNRKSHRHYIPAVWRHASVRYGADFCTVEKKRDRLLFLYIFSLSVVERVGNGYLHGALIDVCGVSVEIMLSEVRILIQNQIVRFSFGHFITLFW